MNKPIGDVRKILITGGTSGLGLELVRLYLRRGFDVVATGRKQVRAGLSHERFKLFQVDFSNLKETAITVNRICDICNFDIIINNAGVLGPRNLIVTGDGFEYTFQVNFLSHFLLNNIIINRNSSGKPLASAVVTSGVYRIADSEIAFPSIPGKYRSFRAYTGSKLYLALMSEHLSEKYSGANVKFIGFDPGVFTSGIFRMQNRFLRGLYIIGAPFMHNPANAASVLSDLIEKDDLMAGSVYDLKKRVRKVPAIDGALLNDFWEQCYKSIEEFL